MKIINRTACKTPQRSWFGTTIQTDFQPSEIIAIRPDGTSESTDPEALKLHQSIEKAKSECEAEVNRLKSLLAANEETGKSELREIKRLESELKAANDSCERFKRQRDAAYGDNQALIAERDQLKRQLDGAVTQTIVKESGYNSATGESFITFTNGSTVKFNNVDSAPFAGLAELRADRDKIAGRLSKCREEKREIATNYNGLVETFDQIKRALGHCKSSDVVSIINGLQSTIAKLHIAESGRFTDERNALVSELSQAKAELQRLKTTYSMDRVHGMTLEEVRGMKRALAENREMLDAARAELALKNKWIEGARELEAIRVELASKLLIYI